MSRKFVTELADGEPIDEVFLAGDKQLRPNRNGQLYLQVRLSDKTGSLTAMLWNADQRQYDQFNNGDFLRVSGTAQLYGGNMQVIVKSLRRVEATEVEPSDFETMSSVRIAELVNSLQSLIDSIRNVHLRRLGTSLLADQDLMDKFVRAPAGVKNHHAYQGGLLEHVVALAQLAAAVSRLYDELDPDLMIMGAVLHDIGKIDELTYAADLGYSDEGQLVGHLIQGVSLLDRKLAELAQRHGEPFPADLAMQLRHVIVSHHGEYEFGSPKLPMTREAIALHYLDNLDAKLATVRQLIREDANSSSVWTSYNAMLGRKIYKGPGAPTASDGIRDG
ncbi:MAG TPA: HD domain-containing protein [Pirellulaceae bacterium]|nr:HD domain-containing protein [Pirellulaceae bacterium]